MRNKLEVICIYRSNEGREVDYNSIIMGKDDLDLDDYQAENFWQTMGGVSITVDGYKTIFHSTNFYNITKVTSFLIHSLYFLNQKKCEWFDSEDKSLNQITLETVDHNILKLSVLDDKKINLSYISASNGVESVRGKHFFENEIFEIVVWIREVKLALQEYFRILNRSIENSAENNTIKIMKQYNDIFSRIC